MTEPVALCDQEGWQELFPSFESVSDEDERDLAGLEPAWGKVAAFFRTGHRFGHPKGSMRCQSLVEVHRLLDVFRKRYEEGNTLSLLQKEVFELTGDGTVGDRAAFCASPQR